MNRRGVVSILAILLLAVTAAFGGDLYVSGPVNGTWELGTHVIINGPATVEAAAGLYVEPGVLISVETTAPFEIHGSFSAIGTAQSPIIIRPSVEWAGFVLSELGSDVRHFANVVIDPGLAAPSRVIEATNSMVEVTTCDFTSVGSCLDLTGGRAWIKSNKLLSTGLQSATVRINWLYNDITNACERPDGNKFCDNIVTAWVESTGPRPRRFTTAFYLNGSSNLCIANNTFTVRAPYSCVGTYFGEDDLYGNGLTVMERCNVAVRSMEGTPHGVLNANEGSLRVVHCNVDVGSEDPSSVYATFGVTASQLADVTVNSSSIVIDRGSLFFYHVDGGLLSYDYNTRWSNSGLLVPGGGASSIPEGGKSTFVNADDDPGLMDGGHNIDADPMWLRDGGWGEWTNEGEVASYYSLQVGSPCIDAGDTLFGWDPDDSRPDIGRYPFEGSDAGEPQPVIQLPADLSVGAAYPNPFNMSTTVPFELSRESTVDIRITDVLGRSIYRESLGHLVLGRHELRWDASGLGSGTYFVQVSAAAGLSTVQRVYLLK
jgi:hypothetical protein